MGADKHNTLLKESRIETPLGPMIAVASEDTLYLLEFLDCRGLARERQQLQHRTHAEIVPGITTVIQSIKIELKAYFEGNLRHFKTPLFLVGTCFQKQVWEALLTVPYGETRSYQEQACLIDRPSACRAVANANGANQIAIVIPCHRIIASGGQLGGYAGGIDRKKWLFQHEKEKNYSV